MKTKMSEPHQIILGEISFDKFSKKIFSSSAIKILTPYEHILNTRWLELDKDAGVIFYWNGSGKSIVIEKDVNQKIKKTNLGFLFYKRAWDYEEDENAEEEMGLDGCYYKPLKKVGEPTLESVSCEILVAKK